MNIFVLDQNPAMAAKYHCDKHVVKMILETAQLLSTAHRTLDGQHQVGLSPSGRKQQQWILPDEREIYLYKATHVNHPCAIWCRETLTNYNWLYTLGIELCYEYTRRYNKIHLCQTKIFDEWLSLSPDALKKKSGLTPFAQAMPDQYKNTDPVVAYRNYYINEKEK